MILRQGRASCGGLAFRIPTRPAFAAIQARAISERAEPSRQISGNHNINLASKYRDSGTVTGAEGILTQQPFRPEGYADRHVDGFIRNIPSSTSRMFPRPDEFGSTRFLKAAVDMAARTEAPEIPNTLPIVPDVPTFLLIIGRGMKKYAEKFPTWDSFWGATSEQLTAAIPLAKDRRYIQDWMRRYRNREYGTAWNLKHIHEGQAILAVYKVPGKKGPGSRVVVNVPAGKTGHTITPEEVHVMGYPYRVKGSKIPCGPHARAFKGHTACIDSWDGLWELPQGEKVDGGERRRKEVRFLRRVAARKALRGAEEGALY